MEWNFLEPPWGLACKNTLNKRFTDEKRVKNKTEQTKKMKKEIRRRFAATLQEEKHSSKGLAVDDGERGVLLHLMPADKFLFKLNLLRCCLNRLKFHRAPPGGFLLGKWCM